MFLRDDQQTFCVGKRWWWNLLAIFQRCFFNHHLLITMGPCLTFAIFTVLNLSFHGSSTVFKAPSNIGLPSLVSKSRRQFCVLLPLLPMDASAATSGWSSPICLKPSAIRWILRAESPSHDQRSSKTNNPIYVEAIIYEGHTRTCRWCINLDALICILMLWFVSLLMLWFFDFIYIYICIHTA